MSRSSLLVRVGGARRGCYLRRMVFFSKWHPGGRCSGPRVVVMLQSGWSGRGGGEVLGRWPSRARVLALGCCAGPHGRVVAGNILSEVTALSGRAEPRWVLAGGQQVPSESVARRSRHVRQVEWRVGPMCRADCGR